MFTVEFKNNDNYGEIEFPCDENYLFSKLNELRVEDMLNPQLTAVKIDVDELKFVEGKQTNVDELNFLAKYLESLIEQEVDTFLAIVQAKHISTLKSAINAAFHQSDYTLIQNISNMEQIGNWQQHSYVCLGGVAVDALNNILKNHPEIDTVYLCVDNDTAGDKTVKRIGEELTERSIEWQRLLPGNKDWNEDLVELREQEQTQDFNLSM